MDQAVVGTVEGSRLEDVLLDPFSYGISFGGVQVCE